MEPKRFVLDSLYKTHQAWFDCHVTSIRDVLHYYGTNISPYMCFGIGGGINFNYIPVNVTVKCNNPPVKLPFWVIMGSNVTYVDICHEFNITPHVYRFTNKDVAWEQTKKFIDNKQPVLIDVVDLFLYKKEIGPLNDMPFLKNLFDQIQVPEFIDFITSGSKNLVIGYDDIKESAIIIYTIFLAPIEIPISLLKKLRSEEKACPPVFNETVVFDVPEKSLPIDYLITKGITKCCLRMMDNNMYTQDTDGRKYSQGLKGIKQFFSDLETMSDIIPDKDMLKKTFFVSSMLSRGFANRWGAYRFPFGKFLQESAKINGNKTFNSIGANYLGLSEKWTLLMDIIGAKVLAENFDFVNDSDTKKLLQNIIDEEERNISLLYKEIQ
ncbi:MAG: DUF4872 domain-containing protein [Bacteroidales bacterium]|nr:DUF4872 domain-containing protein [Bacteroidales bacterium]